MFSCSVLFYSVWKVCVLEGADCESPPKVQFTVLPLEDTKVVLFFLSESEPMPPILEI